MPACSSDLGLRKRGPGGRERPSWGRIIDDINDHVCVYDHGSVYDNDSADDDGVEEDSFMMVLMLGSL